MGFTFRLILAGLIAIVQNQDGTLTAVLVDTQYLSNSSGMPIQEHRSIGLIIDGVRENVIGSNDIKIDVNCNEPENIDQCIFDTDYRKLYFDREKKISSPLSLISGLRYLENGTEVMQPISLGQARDFFWVPSLEELQPDAGVFQEECLGHPEICPVKAIFQIPGGSLGSCHLAHEVDKCRDSQQQVKRTSMGVKAFRFRPNGLPISSQDSLQAVADAVLLETPVLSDRLTLDTSRFKYLGTAFDEAEISVRPNAATNTITILIANAIVEVSDANEDIVRNCGDQNQAQDNHLHFEAYYHLSRFGFAPDQMKVPLQTNENSVELYTAPAPRQSTEQKNTFLKDLLEVTPSSLHCEREMLILEEYVDLKNSENSQDNEKSLRVVPHLIEACPVAFFPQTLSLEQLTQSLANREDSSNPTATSLAPTSNRGVTVNGKKTKSRRQ